MEPTYIGGTLLQPGEILFLAYNSGSRDPGYFADPNKLDVHRRMTSQHLGFGRGIHACLGAPLARLLLSIELEILHERLPGLRLAKGFQKEYNLVSEGRGIDKLLVEWDIKPQAARKVVTMEMNEQSPYVPKQKFNGRVVVTVSDIQVIAENVMLITLSPKDTKNLPTWAPGAHINISVGKFGVRQYSLCSDPKNSREWKVAVLLNTRGTGGSAYIHQTLVKGTTFQLMGPRNHFTLKDSARYISIAGGIGITPIRAMILAARSRNIPYKLLYLGSQRSRMAFVEELDHDHNVIIRSKDQHGAYDLLAGIRALGALETSGANQQRIYVCGPTRLIEALETACAHLPAGVLNLERFDNSSLVSFFNAKLNMSFGVELKQSGRFVHVPAQRSLLEVLNQAGCGIMSTCTKGTCGTCEVAVIDGELEHRDTVLTEEGKREGKSLMACVSRCTSEKLVLDL